MSKFDSNDSNLNESVFLAKINESGIFIQTLSILLTIVMMIGFAGNLLVIYVVCNYNRLKTVTNTYLLHLAVSDLVFLSGVPFFISSVMTRSWIFGRFFCKFFFLSQGVNQYTSVFILTFLSLDRFLAVCFSTHSIWWRSHVHPHLLLILTWIFSFILLLPILIFTTLKRVDQSTVQCVITLPMSSSRLLYLIFVVYTSTITFVLPLLFMSYFYLRVIHRLQKRVNKTHRRSRASTKTRRKVTILVLGVITVHLVCCSPYWAFQMITTSGFVSQTSWILIPFSTLSQFLLFVNSAANPVLYAFISEVFRHSFKRVFYCCSSNKKNSSEGKKEVHRRIVLASTNLANCSPSRTNFTAQFRTELEEIEATKFKPNGKPARKNGEFNKSRKESRPSLQASVSVCNTEVSL